ncbi:SapC family protein [Psychrobium sp. 1_MG-2023]|uniref:SapC family protein n=1 Tax=Psychrobium sp. 1_MG-2023 TaxID=3062624 RepID=UPI000C31C349|nr:SapC family protein [Psychrobium sp. 1_MG-2023]MDP2559531.1 SapC family protein [Psychrobium sp. 1_MG-2023]PKF59371.1 multidrug transporter [Alteromonadales bacterium alter-6D02]
MTSSISPLNAQLHKELKIQEKHHYPHTKGQHILPVLVHEFAEASAEMPVVFVKNTETGQFQPVVILGFQSGENVFCSDEQWLINYVPAIATHYPFALVASEDNPQQFQLGIKDVEVLAKNTEGELLFDQNGAETAYLEKRKNTLGQYYENSLITEGFVKLLADKDLLEEQTLSLTLKGDKIDMNGIYLVNQEKLQSLPAEDFLLLRSKNYLLPIYSHINSLRQIQKLVALKQK